MDNNIILCGQIQYNNIHRRIVYSSLNYPLRRTTNAVTNLLPYCEAERRADFTCGNLLVLPLDAKGAHTRMTSTMCTVG